MKSRRSLGVITGSFMGWSVDDDRCLIAGLRLVVPALPPFFLLRPALEVPDDFRNEGPETMQVSDVIPEPSNGTARFKPICHLLRGGIRHLGLGQATQND